MNEEYNRNRLLLNECTILVCSCDDYEDLWIPFFKLLHKYWIDCPCKIILNTESKVFKYDGLDIICFSMYKNKNVPYGKRMLEHLNKIKTEYVLLLMDDFFIRKEVNEFELIKVIRWMKENTNIACFSFQHYDDKYNKSSKIYEDYELRPVYGEYKLNFQAAIWNKKKLIESWKMHETPWEWETIANYRTFKSNWAFYVINDDKNTPIDYGFKHSGMGVFRGKWILDSVEKLFKENNIVVDFSKRGIYTTKDKNIQRMVKSNRMVREFRNCRSLGISYYTCCLLWRIYQQMRKLMGLDYSTDYIEFKREKKENHIRRKDIQ